MTITTFPTYEQNVAKRIDDLIKRFMPPFGRVFQPPFATSGAIVAPWYLADGDVIGNCLAAHQSLGATSLAASYDDIAHTATTWDCSPGVAPTFDSSYGWYSNNTKWLLVGSDAIKSVVPITYMFLFKADDITNFYVIGGIGNYSAVPISAEQFRLDAAGTVVGDPLRALVMQSGSFALAVSTSGYTAGNWCVGTAVFAANNSRLVYVNGGSEGTNTTLKTPGIVNRTTIFGIFGGSTAPTNIFKGYVGADAWYSVAKTPAQQLDLATAMLALVP